MVVLPVDGEYWMEGTYHILSRDMDDRPIFPKLDLSRCMLSEDNSVYNYRRNFVGKVWSSYSLNSIHPLLVIIEEILLGSDEVAIPSYVAFIFCLSGFIGLWKTWKYPGMKKITWKTWKYFEKVLWTLFI